MICSLTFVIMFLPKKRQRTALGKDDIYENIASKMMRRLQFPKTYSTGEKDWVRHRLQNRQPAPTDRSERQGLRTCRLKPLPKGINIWSPSNYQHCNFSGFHQTLSSAPNVKHIYLPHQFESMHRSHNPMLPNLPRIVSEPKRKCPKAQTRQQNTSYITAADWMPHRF